MTPKDENVELSYQMQRENFISDNEEIERLRHTWFQTDTVDYWRHHRMVTPIKPLLDYYKGSKWLTVGDGRYGLDSIELKRIQPDLHILPTDIAPELLKQAKDKQLISDYSIENAESMSFP